MKTKLIFAIILAATAASGATIDSFTVSAAGGSPFTLILNNSFTGNTALVTSSTITCSSSGETPCSGPVLNFTISASGLTSSTPVVISIDGSLTGSATGIGSISLTSPVTQTIPFTFASGNFTTSILNTSFPTSSSLTLTGVLSMTLGLGNAVTLHSSLCFTIGSSSVSTAPEPGTFGMLGAGLLALGGMYRRLRG